MQKQDAINKMRLFRKQMGLTLSKDMQAYIWGKAEFPKEISSERKKKKLLFAQKYLKVLLVSGVVRFIGVSGSIAAGTLKENDDIDIFVVVKDYSAWFFRGITFLVLRLLGVLRVLQDSDVNNKFCINFIMEERGILFNEQDIFVLHELFYLVPLYNPFYKDFIICNNKWLRSWAIPISKFCEKSQGIKKENTFFLISFFNSVLFQLQILYSKLSHSEVMEHFDKKLDYKNNGYIRSFQRSFKENILTNLDE